MTAFQKKEMTKQEKDSFVRYIAPHFYAQQPKPDKGEYAAMARACSKVAPCLKDKPGCSKEVQLHNYLFNIQFAYYLAVFN